SDRHRPRTRAIQYAAPMREARPRVMTDAVRTGLPAFAGRGGFCKDTSKGPTNMALPTNTFTTYSAAGNREDLSDVIYRIDPPATPFMTGIEKPKATAVNHE